MSYQVAALETTRSSLFQRRSLAIAEPLSSCMFGARQECPNMEAFVLARLHRVIGPPPIRTAGFRCVSLTFEGWPGNHRFGSKKQVSGHPVKRDPRGNILIRCKCSFEYIS